MVRAIELHKVMGPIAHGVVDIGGEVVQGKAQPGQGEKGKDQGEGKGKDEALRYLAMPL